ncbi:MAG: Maf family protein [Acidimicrobiales bacterium]
MAPNGASSRPRLVLASASPCRRELLAVLGISPDVEPVDIDERAEEAESPRELVLRLAREKAAAAIAAVPDRGRVVVIGADTVLDVDGEIFAKPSCDAEARTMLSRLSGRCHRVLTGVAVAAEDQLVSDVDITLVRFRSLDAADIDCYVASGEPRGKAGAYALQGRGALFVDRIEGSYHGVVGLPVHLVDQLCERVGWSLWTWVDTVETGGG